MRSMTTATHHRVLALWLEDLQNHPNLTPKLATLRSGREGSHDAGHIPALSLSTNAHIFTTLMEHASSSIIRIITTAIHIIGCWFYFSRPHKITKIYLITR